MKCFIARTDSQLERIYRLRYECYRRDQSIMESADERFRDEFDELPNSLSILAETSGGDIAATVRISVVRNATSWRDSPAQHVFGDDPSLRRISASSYVEASRLCFAAHARRDAFMRLTGYMAALAQFYETEWLVACPRVEHVETYKRLFGFRALAEARQYFGVNFQTQLLGTRRSDLGEFVRAARPMKAAWAEAFQRLAGGAMLLSA